MARAWGRLRRVKLSLSEPLPSLVTVGIAVHDGAGQIADRVANVLEQDVPFELEIVVASDGSSDGTNAAVRALAAAEPRVKLLELARRGQSAAQSAIFEAARGEIVVLTDLETRFAPGCLAALVAPFADPRVGCVTGVLGFRFADESEVASSEGAYWRYELAVRAWESRAGWLSTATGALLASRRSTYRPAPVHASLDQMLPLFCRADGCLVLVAPAAHGQDRGTSSLHEQFTTRTRIATQGISANLRMSLRIPPWRRPGTFMAIWSHKLLRWATPIWIVAMALSGLFIFLRSGEWIYLLPPLFVGLVLMLALVGLAARSFKPASLALTLVAVNLAFGLAWINLLLRKRMGAW